VPAGQRRPAHEQLERARARAQDARDRASARRVARVIGPDKAAHAYSNAPNAGVAIALGLLVLMGATTYAVLNHSFSRPAPPPIQGAPASLPGTPVALLPRFDEPLPGPIPPHQGDDVIPGNTVTRTVGLAATTMNFAVEQQLRNSRVLVVSEARPPYAKQTDRLIRERLDSLRARKMVVVNDPFASPTDDPKDLSVEDLIAHLHLIRAERSLDSRSLSDQISTWIDQTQGVDYVVWIEPNPTAKQDVLIELFTPSTSGADLTVPLRLLANYAVEQIVQPKRN